TAVQYRAPLNPVPLQHAAWEKLAIDIVGPLQNSRYGERFAITLVDYYSKWPEVKFSQNATTKDVIQFLKEIFSHEGLPEVVSDNGVQFTSNEFKQFLNDHAIRHCRTYLYYPQANGEVERFNRVLKACLQLASRTGRPRSEVVTEFVMHYRATPHAVTGETPSRLLHGQTLKTKLDSPFSCFSSPKPDEAVCQKVVKKQQYMRDYYGRRRGIRLPHFKPGDMVRVQLQRTSGKGPSFSKLVQIASKVNYATYKLCDGRVFNAANVTRRPLRRNEGIISTSEVKVHIEKLTGKENWEFWKENVRLLLEFHDLFGIVDGSEKCPVSAEVEAASAGAMDELEKFKRKDTHAKLLITTNIEKDMRRKLGVVKTAKEMCDRLVSIHEQSCGYQLDRLSMEFFSARKDPSVSYLEYIATVQRTFHHLCEETQKQLGFEIPEKMLLLRITPTIPPEHRTVRQIWDATPAAERKLSDLIERLQLAEEFDNSDQDGAAFAVKSTAQATSRKSPISNATGNGEGKGFPFKCRKCGRRGHKASNCRLTKDRKSSKENGLKRGVVTGMVDRAVTICDPEFLNSELHHIATALQKNGYPQNFVTSTITRRLHVPRDRPDDEGNTYNVWDASVATAFTLSLPLA
ncbi:hypothetical protein M513_13398, partial [Trichuris suis]